MGLRYRARERRRKRRVIFVMGKDCPHCKAISKSWHFNKLLSDLNKLGIETIGLITQVDADLQEATAFWSGLTIEERFTYIQGGRRGTAKTMTVVVWEEGDLPHARVITDEEDDLIWMELASLASKAIPRVPPRVRRYEPKGRKKKEKR